MKLYSDVWVTSGPLWLPQEQEVVKEKEVFQEKGVVQEKKDATGETVPIATVDDNSTKDQKKRKVRPPRPRAKKVSYPVIGKRDYHSWSI